jgi:hypothetical protein
MALLILNEHHLRQTAAAPFRLFLHPHPIFKKYHYLTTF